MSNRKSFYKTQAWKKTSSSYMQSVGGLCERCLAKGLITPAEVVHHKVPLNDDNVSDYSISLSWNNLEALCRSCHAEAHEEMYRQRRKRRYKVDDKGHVIAID